MKIWSSSFQPIFRLLLSICLMYMLVHRNKCLVIAGRQLHRNYSSVCWHALTRCTAGCSPTHFSWIRVGAALVCHCSPAASASKLSIQDWAWHHHSFNGCSRSWHLHRLWSQHAGACPAICRGLLRSPMSVTQHLTICPIICVSVAGRCPGLIAAGLW